ncbi:MAG: ABC transporter ATP-binding protein [Sporichthya sp.]|nr:ABC transporter ATP-binding protein [Sporichthya sp.]MBA3743359.1 ABC transporter ATP-binding protein [Sporichthya sp.]
MTAPARGPAPPEGRQPGPTQAAALLAMPVEKSLNFTASSKRLLRMMRPERVLVAIAVALGTLSVSLSVLGPYLLGKATDVVVGGVITKDLPANLTDDQVIAQLEQSGRGELADLVRHVDATPGQGVDFTKLGHLLLIALSVYALGALFSLLQGRLVANIVQRLVFRLRAQTQSKLERLPLRYFDTHPRGEILSRATNDIDNVAQTLQQSMSQLLTSLLTIIGVLSMMFWISPLLALVVLISVPLSIRVTKAIGKRSQPEFIKQWSTTGRLNAHVEEMYTGHALVRAFGRSPQSAQIFAEHNDELCRSSFKAQFISGVIGPTMQLIGNLTYVVVAVVGGLRVASGSLSLGDVQAFIQYTRQFSMPVTQAASMANLLQSGIASAERVFDLLDAEEQSAEPAPVPRTERTRGAVEFENVHFRYIEDRPLIENLSLSVPPGATVAIVGPTGAGKTTLVNLLLRFYDLDAGRITIDGVDIATLPRPQVRSDIGMVLQDTWLFGGTVADNIAYGRDGVGRDEVVEAAKATHVDHLVRTLPDGYDTVLDADGADLSAGERQLVTIARAFLANPPILVLDEATSFVDTRTELLIQRGTSTLSQGRTCFVIAHRLSTIRDADVILVMEDGQIVETGTHASLIASAGAYARLYEAQFAAPAAETG